MRLQNQCIRNELNSIQLDKGIYRSRDRFLDRGRRHPRRRQAVALHLNRRRLPLPIAFIGQPERSSRVAYRSPEHSMSRFV
jgi:hypothetical protein